MGATWDIPANQFGRDEFQAASGANPSAMDDLERYRQLLEDWSTRMNLVGPSALDQFWGRHAWDSAQLRGVAPGRLRWADVGAGAGFPGIVLAILLKGEMGAEVHLIESMTKRCRFLSKVVLSLHLPAIVHNARAEHTRIGALEVVTARACAPMVRLLEYAHPLMADGALGLFLKGRDVAPEIAEAKVAWRFDADLLPSRSGPDGHIVRVEKLSRA